MDELSAASRRGEYLERKNKPYKVYMDCDGNEFTQFRQVDSVQEGIELIDRDLTRMFPLVERPYGIVLERDTLIAIYKQLELPDTVITFIAYPRGQQVIQQVTQQMRANGWRGFLKGAL